MAVLTCAAFGTTNGREYHMPLIDCPACGRQISVEAEACPQCGHPNRPATPAPAAAPGPKCYACHAAATTRCQSCNALSCAVHLESIYVAHGQGGGYELRCSSCYDSAMTWEIVGFVFVGIAVVVMLVVMSQMSMR